MIVELGRVFREDPPLFIKRTPHGYFDAQRISRDLADAGFGATPRFRSGEVDGKIQARVITVVR